MSAKPKFKLDLKAIVSNPLFRPLTNAILPPIRKKIGERPLLAIGAVATGLAGVVKSGILPPKISDPLAIGVLAVGFIVGQLPVTPVAAPKLTPAQAAKVKLLPAKAKGK
jgi:hypothetical protein